jgi:hypothetical protein
MIRDTTYNRLNFYFPFKDANGSGGGAPTVYVGDGVVLSETNYIANTLQQVSGNNGLRNRFLIRFKANRTGNYNIITGGPFSAPPCISVTADVIFLYGVSTGVTIVNGNYYEIVCGGEAVTVAYINGITVGSYATGNSTPEIIKNCTVFEFLTGRDNEVGWLSDSAVIANIYNLGAGFYAENTEQYYGFTNAQVVAGSPCQHHYRFDEILLRNDNLLALRLFRPIRGIQTRYFGTLPPTFITKNGLTYD